MCHGTELKHVLYLLCENGEVHSGQKPDGRYLGYVTAFSGDNGPKLKFISNCCLNYAEQCCQQCKNYTRNIVRFQNNYQKRKIERLETKIEDLRSSNRDLEKKVKLEEAKQKIEVDETSFNPGSLLNLLQEVLEKDILSKDIFFIHDSKMF